MRKVMVTTGLMVALVGLYYFSSILHNSYPLSIRANETGEPANEVVPSEDECLFYGREPLLSSFSGTDFPYPREKFNNHLIDLIYLLNWKGGLVGEEGWTRVQSLLKECQKVGVVLYKSSDHLFHETTEFMANWFEAYGCKSVEVLVDVNQEITNSRVWVAIGIRTPVDIDYSKAMIVQTEQMSARHWAEALRPAIERCRSISSCVVLEFSESNAKLAVNIYGKGIPTIILPITLRNTPKPQSIRKLKERTGGYIFLGYGNHRRDAITSKLDTIIPRWRGDADEGYGNCRLCISVHYYSSESGIEYHRLAQHSKYGCLPLYEMTGDTLTNEFFKHHKTLFLVKYDDFLPTAFKMLHCIKEYPKIMEIQQDYITKWWTDEIEGFKNVFLALFYEK